MSSLRDWGHAKDYVRAQWLILRQDIPEDYVIATGEQHSVREFCQRAFAELGIELEWKGEGPSEQGIIAALNPSPLLSQYSRHGGLRSITSGKPVIFVDPRYFRPAEVDRLLGDPAKARAKLGWRAEISFDEPR